VTSILTMQDFADLAEVSRETLACLEAYLNLLQRWQRALNLVGPKTLADPWRRHILDSTQILPHLPDDAEAIYDLGSGAGLPGLVLALMGQAGLHLVESDQRKAQFLREAARTLGVNVNIHTQRIEALPSQCADVVIARALAPLPRLLNLSAVLLKPNGICLFLKGQNVSHELTEAHKCWRMSIDRVASLSDPSATLLKLRDIKRAPLHC